MKALHLEGVPKVAEPCELEGVGKCFGPVYPLHPLGKRHVTRILCTGHGIAWAEYDNCFIIINFDALFPRGLLQ